MKNAVIGGIVVFAATLLTPQFTQAQGTLYLSSLSPTSTGSAPVGSDSWLAAGFGTGNNLGGYTLNSVQLGMEDATGNPSGFTVMIYSAIVGTGIAPGSDLGTLTGSANPSASGVYNYTAPPSLSLSPLTVYFIVVTSSTAVANGAYIWNESAYPPGVNSWPIDNAVNESGNGTSGWTSAPYFGIPQLAIYATPTPEPGVIGLFALGGLLVAFQRRKTRSV